MRERLGALLATDAGRQAETPLELVRVALGPLTVALMGTGIEPSGRDEQQRRAVPDDPYDLSPASPADLGPEVAAAAVAWGAAKARRFTRPLLLLVGTNLMDRGAFESAAERAGYAFEMVSAVQVSRPRPLVAFVDLEAEGADDAIRVLADRGVRVVAYGPHVDDMALTRARALGAAAAEPRGRVLRDPESYLPPLV